MQGHSACMMFDKVWAQGHEVMYSWSVGGFYHRCSHFYFTVSMLKQSSSNNSGTNLPESLLLRRNCCCFKGSSDCTLLIVWHLYI